MRQILYAFALLLAGFSSTYGQVTTASVYGNVTDQAGAGLPGATILAVHQPTGTQYGVTTRAEGQYNLPNMRVGGPYIITVTYVGFKTQTLENVSLSLGQKLPLNARLVAESQTLTEVKISADANDVLNNARTGAQTNISSEQLRTLPTIKRSIFDYTRLTPMSGGDGSFGGRNFRYNNFSLNGANFNNPFGLDAATPGGQADAQPVSLDAIEQVQVALSPFDVTQSGFTGAAVNAVTKSGTNEVHGTVFGFTRNQDLTGKRVKGTDITVPASSQNQFGFSLGGPLIKNKLFFFINAEGDRRSDLGTAGWVANRPGLTGTNVSRVLASDLDLVGTTLRGLGYEPGGYENFTHKTTNNKGILKLDWNISQNHKLSFIYNFLDAKRDLPANPSALGRRGPDFLTLQYYSSGYQIVNKLNGGIVELNSNFNGKFANKLQVGYTVFNDSRNPFSTPFATININKDGVRYIVAGHEPFSINNRLDQRVFQFTDNVNIYAGKHTITLGTSFEKFSFDNSFNLGTYDGGGTFGPGYASVTDFVAASKTADFAKLITGANATFAAGKWALAQTNVGQFAVYGQDEFAITPKFNLTYGLKVDLPLYFNTKDKVQENIDRGAAYFPDIQYYNENATPVKLNSLELPKQTPLFSPRIGFNYDILGNGTRKLRGGTGLFTGRFPFVWIGNQVANPNFFFYCTTSPDFKFPQVWKTSLGYDHKFASGWIASADILYNKDVNAMLVRNYGLKTPSGTLQTPDSRPYYKTTDKSQQFGDPVNAYVFTNTSLGYSFNSSLQVQRTWSNGMYVSLGYNFLTAREASSLSAEISSDAYDRNPTYGNVNQALNGQASYGNQQRFVGSLSKRFAYGNRWATTLSALTEYTQGARYSYTYAGDINNDGGFSNDLLFIPTAAQVGTMRFSGTDAQQTAQRAGLEAYILQDKYLSANRGKVAEKFAAFTPWFSTLDVRILQELRVGKQAKNFQLSVDILNFGNLLNSNWGVRQFASYTGLAQPLGVSSDAATGVVTYSFDANQKTTFFNDSQLISRWRMQVGLRYSF